jgi:hypothetical protein
MILAAAMLWPLASQATPYASCITNNAGTIQFYLNESGGNVTVTYEDGTTNASFDGITTGLNLASGTQSFALGSHTSYTISVFKVGTGSAAVIHTLSYGTPRGIDVNKNPSSPYFGNVYASCASAAAPTNALRQLNSDLSGISTNSGGVAWLTSSSEPYRLLVCDDDYLAVGSYSSAGHSGVWRISPDLTTNQNLLGPPGDTAGSAANSHGAQIGDCRLLGNMQNGDECTLFTVDAGSFSFNSSQLNSLLVYSNLTLANIPRITAPDLLGPEITLNLSLQNNYPSISVGPPNQLPTRYIYISNRRDGPSGGSADLQIYALTNLVVNTSAGSGVNLSTTPGAVWNSYYNGTVNDYFAVNGTGPSDSSVSPDGKYFAAEGYGNNQIVVCSLTNGIPDVSTIYTVTNSGSTTAAGRGVCWDAADNVYLASSGGGFFQEWTLGSTATAVTTGNASGPTGFALVLPSVEVGVVATNSIQTATVSQANSYGNPTNATFVISRSGNTASALQVFFSLGGTAANTTYSANHTTSVVLLPGFSSTNISITAVTDGIARPTTTIVLALSQSSTYSVSPSAAALSLINTAPNVLVASPLAASMYNAFSNDYASFIITRWGDTTVTFNSGSFTYGGTAIAGTDYTYPAPVTFNPGDLTSTNYIYPLSNGQLPVDSTSNPYVGNKTAIIGITGSTNTALLNILDSANPTTTVLFADPLTDASDAANWTETDANDNMQADAIDSSVTFGYDLQNGDPSDFGAIPLPPSGAATALRVTVNKSNGAAAGVNLYPGNHVFSGNYAVRFNMIIVQGLSDASSTEGPLFGINHSGIDTNWFSASGVTSGWGTPPSTAWSSDGIWYWVNADNDYSAGAYQEYTGAGGTNNNTGWQPLASQTAATFANAFKTNVFSGGIYWGPGLVSSASILNAPPYANWADVEIKQLNSIVTLSIGKTPVFVYTNTTTFTNGNLMLGYNDPFNSIGSVDGSVYYSNLRVVSLASPVISQIAVNHANNTAVINFTTVDGDTTAASFALQSASVVRGPYADVASASITQLSAGAFQAVVPRSGAVQFYRIRQK